MIMSKITLDFYKFLYYNIDILNIFKKYMLNSHDVPKSIFNPEEEHALMGYFRKKSNSIPKAYGAPKVRVAGPKFEPEGYLRKESDPINLEREFLTVIEKYRFELEMLNIEGLPEAEQFNLNPIGVEEVNAGLPQVENLNLDLGEIPLITLDDDEESRIQAERDFLQTIDEVEPSANKSGSMHRLEVVDEAA